MLKNNLFRGIGINWSRKSLKNYFLWRRQKALSLVIKINRFVSINNSNILDLGCGYGALSDVLSSEGGKITAIEADKKSFSIAKKFIGKKKTIKLIFLPEGELPFRNNHFDIVILSDVIEHVKNPLMVMNEVKRVLKQGGILYVDFTPYYSITGHHLYDYSKLPIHILPQSVIKKIVFSKKTGSIFCPSDDWETFKSLNKLRISTFQDYTKTMATLEERFIVKYPGIFEFNIPFINYLGKFKDIFTIGFEGIYKK